MVEMKADRSSDTLVPVTLEVSTSEELESVDTTEVAVNCWLDVVIGKTELLSIIVVELTLSDIGKEEGKPDLGRVAVGDMEEKPEVILEVAVGKMFWEAIAVPVLLWRGDWSGEDDTTTEEDTTLGMVVVATISIGWFTITSSICLRRRAWFSTVAGAELTITVEPVETNHRTQGTTMGFLLPLLILIPCGCSVRY